MTRIDPESTVLSKYGLTVDAILDGDAADFDPEKKLNRKGSYVQYDFAKAIVGAYADDLLQAYRVIEELEAELAEVTGNLESVSGQAQKASTQVKRMLAGDQKFADAEKLLAKFESQMELLAKDKQVDQATITKLRTEVSELITLRDEVPKLRADVDAVLTNLQSYFEEADIPIPFDDSDDWEEP